MANTATIKLNLINHSNDTNNSSILIFQQNVAPAISELAVAWKVIRNMAPGDNHPFTFSYALTVEAIDSDGNCTQQLPANPGDAYAMVRSTSGDVLQRYLGGPDSPTDLDIRNDLLQGAITANVYRDGKLLAQKTGIPPGAKATFQFKPNIFIGVASEIDEGGTVNAAVVSDINTEISLTGLASADILMTGGGTGPDAVPFAFQLENIKFA